MDTRPKPLSSRNGWPTAYLAEPPILIWIYRAVPQIVVFAYFIWFAVLAESFPVIQQHIGHISSIYGVFSYLFVSSYREGYKSVDTELADDKIVREEALHSILRDFKLQDAQRRSIKRVSSGRGKDPSKREKRGKKSPSKISRVSRMRNNRNVNPKPYQESSRSQVDKESFAAYVVNPSDAILSHFARRENLYAVFSVFLVAAYIFQLPYILISGFGVERLSPNFAVWLLLFATMSSIEAMGRKFGWYFRMGGVARRVRRYCLEDVGGGEKMGKEGLVWWIEGLLRNDMDCGEWAKERERNVIVPMIERIRC